MVFYAVRKGWNRGVYETWKECKHQINGYQFPSFRKFSDRESAKRFAFPELYPLDAIEKEENDLDFRSDKNKSEEFERNLKKQKTFVQDLVDRELVLPTRVASSKDRYIDVWITASKVHDGVIGVYFGKDDPRNYVGVNVYRGTVNMTRLRLVACIKSIQNIIETKDNPCTLIIHSQTRYLGRSLIEWTKEWYSRGKDKDWAKSEPNHDLLEQICALCYKSDIRLVPVFSKQSSCQMDEICRLIECQ